MAKGIHIIRRGSDVRRIGAAIRAGGATAMISISSFGGASERYTQPDWAAAGTSGGMMKEGFFLARGLPSSLAWRFLPGMS